MKRYIFGTLSGVSLLMFIGSAGAMERFAISNQQGTIQIFGFLALFIELAYLAGAFPEKKNRLRRGNVVRRHKI